MTLPVIKDIYAYTSGDKFIQYSEGYPNDTGYWDRACVRENVTDLIKYVKDDLKGFADVNLIRVSHTITIVHQDYVDDIIRKQALAKLTDDEKRVLGWNNADR